MAFKRSSVRSRSGPLEKRFHPLSCPTPRKASGPPGSLAFVLWTKIIPPLAKVKRATFLGPTIGGNMHVSGWPTSLSVLPTNSLAILSAPARGRDMGTMWRRRNDCHPALRFKMGS